MYDDSVDTVWIFSLVHCPSVSMMVEVIKNKGGMMDLRQEQLIASAFKAEKIGRLAHLVFGDKYVHSLQAGPWAKKVADKLGCSMMTGDQVGLFRGRLPEGVKEEKAIKWVRIQRGWMYSPLGRDRLDGDMLMEIGKYPGSREYWFYLGCGRLLLTIDMHDKELALADDIKKRIRLLVKEEISRLGWK